MGGVYSSALGDYPYVNFRISCADCGRFGCYRLTGLVEQHGCAITLFDVLDQLVADCWRWHWKVGDAGSPCEVRLVDVGLGAPRPPIMPLRLVKR